MAITRRDLLTLAAGVGLTSVAGCSTAPTVSTPFRTLSASERSGVMLCRQAWGAKPARAGGRPHTITRMTIHHSAVALPDNRGIVARLQAHQRYHQIDKGWVDIAYHAAVDRNGNIFALRDPAIAGDTATYYDTTGHYLVLCEGDFNTEAVTEAQLNGAALVCAWATQQFGIGVDTLASHQQVAPGETDCPGRSLQVHVTNGDLKKRIADTIATGFELRPVCGSEADARVAGITAGR